MSHALEKVEGMRWDVEQLLQWEEERGEGAERIGCLTLWSWGIMIRTLLCRISGEPSSRRCCSNPGQALGGRPALLHPKALQVLTIGLMEFNFTVHIGLNFTLPLEIRSSDSRQGYIHCREVMMKSVGMDVQEDSCGWPMGTWLFCFNFSLLFFFFAWSM